MIRKEASGEVEKNSMLSHGQVSCGGRGMREAQREEAGRERSKGKGPAGWTQEWERKKQRYAAVRRDGPGRKNLQQQ